MTQLFDFDNALKALQNGQALTGKDGILTPLIKQLTEAALAAELDSHLTNDADANRRNGSTKLCNCLILICSIQHQKQVKLWTKNSYRLWLMSCPKISKPQM